MDGKGMILVVEDLPADRACLSGTLEQEGYLTRQADGEKAAFDILADQQPDLILLAGMDGIEILRRLKTGTATRELPIIFITSALEPEKRIEGLSLGAMDCITTPFLKEELLLRVEKCMDLCRIGEQLEMRVADLHRANERLGAEMTERRKVEDALRSSEERFRIMADSCPDIHETRESEHQRAELLDLNQKIIANSSLGIVAYRADGPCIMANPAVARISGAPLEKMLQLNFRHLEQWKKYGLFALAEKALATGEDQRDEVHLVTSFGKDAWLAYAMTSFTSGGEPHLLVIVDDITQRKEAELSLAESERRFRDLAEYLNAGLATTDADFRCGYCNPKFSEKLGFKMEDVIGRTLLDFLFEEDHPWVLEKIRDCMKGAMDRFEICFQRKDGSRLETLLSFSLLQNNRGQFAEILVLMTDISEQKRIAETLHRTRKAESLSIMAGGIAHDFNNLFQAIHGWLEVAQYHNAGAEPLAKLLERSLQSLDKASSLSRRMLDYAGKSMYKAQSIDLAELVLIIKDWLERLAGGRAKILFKTQGELASVLGDPDMLIQVLITLVVNASEAIGDRNGTIHIDIRMVQVDPAQLERGFWPIPFLPMKAVCLSVSDTGSGINPYLLGRIFDPFFTTKGVGRGLGLPAALGILRAHDAGLQVLDFPGGGTSIRMFFEPILDLETPEIGEETGSESAPATITILIVDDDEDLRAGLTEIMQDILHHQVLEAKDGEEAVAIYNQHAGEITLILMDATIPHLTGGEAFDAIRRMHPNARGILCSGYCEDTGLEMARKHHFHGFLKKPFSISELQNAIRDALEDGAK